MQGDSMASNPTPISPQRRALDAPSTAVTLLTNELLEQAIQASQVSERKRMILPLHKSADASLHRMFNVMQPGTYIPPHRHLAPPKDESIVIVRGALCFITFDEAGQVEQMTDIAANSPVFGVDVAAGIFHTFFILEPDTVMFEVKPGPYSPVTDKDFATWAPREGDAGAVEYMAQLRRMREQR
ncbi:MAG TPA: WbuC family cupin fold metalloprotein [Schlesneria sp.]|jgi:cupin fold WbuC family metalloprotein